MLRDLPGRSVILIGINRGQLREGVYNLETSDKSIVQVMLPPNEHLDAK